jgi:hypothetical protein
MPLNRRSLIKALAFLPVFPILNSKLAQALMLQGAQTSTFILLHGMFFMEFYKDHLYVATPDHRASCNQNGHHFCMRRHGGQLQTMGTNIDLYSSLGHGGMSTFPKTIPQFPKSLIDLGPKTTPTYRCKMILPLPKNIFGLRTDVKSNFNPVKGNAIGEAILAAATGPRLATITCLEFVPGKDGPYTESYYAEHKRRPNAADVNLALVAAKEICGNKFNLQLTALPCPPPPAPCFPPAPKDPTASLPNGVSQDDESALDELVTGTALACDEQPCPATAHKENVDVASCPQFGLRG